MIKKELSTRATAYIFDDLAEYTTYVYVINAKKHTFIIDTFCGPDYMKYIIDDLKILPSNTIVVNTHHHWDHIWGNNAFDKCDIVAHTSCPDIISSKWNEMINENHIYANKNVEKVLPNSLFDKVFNFASDEVKFFYSPGHTSDSISVFDSEDKFLYVGDNLEKPQIFIESPDISAYIKTLRNYLTYKAKAIFAGHTANLNDDDIEETIKYLENFK